MNEEGRVVGRQTRMGFGAGVAVLVVLLAIFAGELISLQSKSRHDVENGYADRATISAALTQSLFSASSSSGAEDNAKKYGSKTVPAQKMAAAQNRGHLAFAVLLNHAGVPIAFSPGASVPVLRNLAGKPEIVSSVLGGQAYALSDVVKIGGGAEALEFAQAFDTPFGKRVLVSGFPPELLSVFLGSTLEQVPRPDGGQAYVLDENGAVIASTNTKAATGQQVDEPGLTEAIAVGDRGSFGSNRYFAASSVDGSPWHVALTAPQSTLFASVSGAHKWVPWAIFTAFALVALLALALLRRVLRSAEEMSEMNDKLGVTNEALERRAAELTRSNSELEQFASIASHDLQEPLRKVQTFAAQLEESEADRLSEQGRDYLGRASDAAQRMQALINDLLKFSRVATHAKPFVEVDLSEVAHEVAGDLDTVISETGGVVKIGELPTVTADAFQMRQLLQNLLSNGLKFRREGVPAEVSISGRARGRFAEIEVRDNGIGFDPVYATRIFRVFERLHGRGAYPGTGIGLALCRKIAERHGGTIVAASIPGEGSTFTVSLPLEQSMEPPHAVVPVESGMQEQPYVHA